MGCDFDYLKMSIFSDFNLMEVRNRILVECVETGDVSFRTSDRIGMKL